jgi:threonine dehydrogenase-like Zn-dependent dehydrogenase
MAVSEVDEPPVEDGSVLVDALALGVCGTDTDIVSGRGGQAPPGEESLILGHESLGRVAAAPADSGLSAGDLVAGTVRHPDPVPCSACALGEWDMCRNGRYTEHGIKALHGFGRERWRTEPDRLIRLDPQLGALGVLLEPTSILAKAWEHVERIGQRASWYPEVAVVAGAGPVGLLAALMAIQRGLEVHVFDRNTTGPKPELVGALGATYHTEPLGHSDLRADVLLECIGLPQIVVDALSRIRQDGILCLVGIPTGSQEIPVNVGMLSHDAVLENRVVFGSVNANRRHYEKAMTTLTAADAEWLGRFITRRLPLERCQEAFAKEPGDIKVVIDL